MSDNRRSQSRLRHPLQFAGILLLALSAKPVAASTPPLAQAAPTVDDSAGAHALLAASDLFSAAPDEFRAVLEIRKAGTESGTRMELFQSGRERELVRFLATADRGKFLLRVDGRQYFLAPGSARPVLLAPGHRVQGAAIHELTGLDLTRDYAIESVHEESGVVIFDLVAKASAAAPRIRWVVSRTSRRPLRADLQSSSGKVLRVIEFKTWRDAARGIPALLVIKDLLAGGSPLEVRFEQFEPGPVDATLFDLENDQARRRLLTATEDPPIADRSSP